jgi:hypothetical protein
MSDRLKRTSKARLALTYLHVNLGEWFHLRDLRVVAMDYDDLAREFRRYRQIEGWPLEENGKGYWRLAPVAMLEPRGDGTQITGTQRNRILTRDRSVCRTCGRGVGDSAFDGKPVRLEIHHLIHRDDNGPTTDDNLETRCHVCHKDEHEQPRESEW